MKEGIPMSDNELPSTSSGDIPASWGFHLLQELRRLEDKMDTKIGNLDSKMDAKIDSLESKVDTKIDSLESKMDAKFDAQNTKFDTKVDEVRYEMDQKIDNLRYWSWGTIIVVVASAVATILTILFHH